MTADDPAPPEPGAPPAWEVSLDDPAPAPVLPAPGPRPGGRRRLAVRAAAGVAVVAAVAGFSGRLSAADEEPARQPGVAGSRMPVPVSIPVPPDATATADGSYVGIDLGDTPGVVLATMPTQVVDAGGRRVALPADPARWLISNPRIFVSRVRMVQVGDRTGTQVDYRLSRDAAPGMSRFYRMPLFCGFRPGPDPRLPDSSPCTRIGPDARVRSTFVEVGGRTLMVEAVWPEDSQPWANTPSPIRRTYGALLRGLTVPGDAREDAASISSAG